MERVSQNVWVETKYFGANLGVIKTSLGLFLVDTPMNPSENDLFLQEISEMGAIAWIIVTDHHLDHFMGASFLPGIMISHRDVRGRFLETFGPMEKIVERVSWSDPAGAERVRNLRVKEPSLTFADRMSYYLDRLEIHLETFPGHTPHTIAVRVEPDGVFFSGDNVVNEAPPFFHDTRCPKAWIHSLQQMKALKFQTLVPGHGPLADHGFLDVMIENIERVVEIVQEAINQGMPDKEIQQKVRYLPLFNLPPANPPRMDFWHQLEEKGIGRLINALKKPA